MKRTLTPLALALALAGGVALAGSDAELVAATKLPVQADALRQAGVPDAEVAEAVRAAKAHGLSAGEAEEALEASADSTEEHGRIDNFGKFVNGQLDEGKRGRELAQAIREEHARRGKGPQGKAKGHGDEHPGKGKGHEKHGEDHPGKGKGHDKHGDGADAGHPGKGPPEGKGPKDDKGPPEGKGPKDDRGPKDDKRPKDDAGKGKGKGKAKGKNP
jgi:hypothetical protein